MSLGQAQPFPSIDKLQNRLVHIYELFYFFFFHRKGNYSLIEMKNGKTLKERKHVM